MFLDQIVVDQFRYVFTNTTSPFAITKADGSFLWVNPAFEDLVNYSSYELIEKGITWKEITDDDYLDEDQALVQDCVEGKRISYILYKTYKPKNDLPIPVQIHVLRWPLKGEVEYFFVTARRINILGTNPKRDLDIIRGFYRDIMDSIEKIEQRAEELNIGNTYSKKLAEFFLENRIISYVIICTVLSLLFGDRVLEIIGAFRDLIK